LKAQAINKHKQKRLTGAHVTEKISGRLRRRSGLLQLALVFADGVTRCWSASVFFAYAFEHGGV